jgi:rRNA maturation endonuclease Nob1
MKNITPISIWDNGTNEEAKVLNADCSNDNLSNSATFYYSLLSDNMQQLAQGNLYMSGEDYVAWQTNDYAYNWVAGQLNLTIVGDYVPPVVEPIAEEVIPVLE